MYCDDGEFMLQGTRAERKAARPLLRAAAAAARRLEMTGTAERAEHDVKEARCSY